MVQAEAQALGLTTAISTGYVGFSSSLPFSYTANATPSANQYYFVGVAPQNDFNRYNRAFEDVMDSVKFK